MPTPLSIVEPVINSFRAQNGRHAQTFVPGVIPFARAENDAHVIEFPRIGLVRQVIVRAVRINVVVVITVEEIADVECAAHADEMTNNIRMAEGDV